MRLLRGNQLFGDAGSYGQSLMPPWPSVAAGAIRSRILMDEGIPLKAFAEGNHPHPALGTPQQPGAFTLCALHLARRTGDSVEPLLPAPADLFIPQEGAPQLLRPAPLPAGIQSANPLPQLPMLAAANRAKPAAGSHWLTPAGWQKYLCGQAPARDELLSGSELWRTDERTGVGLDTATRSAKDGRLFANSAIVMHKDVGFAVAVAGCQPPADGLLRFGGDGRAVAVHSLPVTMPQPDWDAIAAQKRCRLILASPGVFADGWLPNGLTQDANGAWRFVLHGVRARLVAAAVPRHETISGWDLARHQPKAAQRTAPAGSVYWLDELDATADALRQLADAGLWGTPCEDEARRAEGFNRLHIAQWGEMQAP